MLDSEWMVLQQAGHNRKVNDILGLLLKEHFPGLVHFGGGLQPAKTFEHYTVVPDLTDRGERVFNTRADRVIGELWVSITRSTHRNH